MPRFYETLITEQKIGLTREQYIDASLVFQKMEGRLRFAMVKGLIAIALCLFFVVDACMGAPFTTDEIIVRLATIVLSLLSFGLLSLYFLIRLPKKEAARAGERYDDSILPGIQETASVYRDSFEVKNEFESMTGFWAECKGCCRKGDMLVVSTTENLSRNMLVFVKPAMTEREFDALCAHFQSAFTGKKYKTLK